MPGQTPATVAASVHFDRCGHQADGSTCWWCLEACTAAITLEWAWTFHTDKTIANKLRRIGAAWSRHYDPAGIRFQLDTSKAEAAPHLTAAQLADDRRTRCDVTRIRNKRAAILLNRGFPDTCALQAKQPQVIKVVAPAH